MGPGRRGRPPAQRVPWRDVGAAHCVDLPFVFGTQRLAHREQQRGERQQQQRTQQRQARTAALLQTGELGRAAVVVGGGVGEGVGHGAVSIRRLSGRGSVPGQGAVPSMEHILGGTGRAESGK